MGKIKELMKSDVSAQAHRAEKPYPFAGLGERLDRVWLAALPEIGLVQFSSILELLLLHLAPEKFDRYVKGC